MRSRAQRRREVDQEIARVLAQSGGRLTDSVEREIERTLSWRPTGACRTSGGHHKTPIARVSDASCASAKAVSLSLRARRAATKARFRQTVRVCACCGRKAFLRLGLLCVQPARATATRCKATSEPCPRSRATIGCCAPQASSRRPNWRARWRRMVAIGVTLLLTWTAETRETVVGETRMALSCAERTAEFSMSIADDWRRLGVGSALLEEIESKAAADGIEWLFGDVLRTNEAMIALARSRGFRLEMGLEGAAGANSEAVGGRGA